MADSVPIATFDDVKNIQNADGLLVDVREPKELVEVGAFPFAVNIPLGQVEAALKIFSSDEFERLFHHSKPNYDTPIIFSCQLGRRGDAASKIALGLGYKNVRNYQGAFREWAEKMQQQ